jgi:hypothetical protein
LSFLLVLVQSFSFFVVVAVAIRFQSEILPWALFPGRLPLPGLYDTP